MSRPRPSPATPIQSLMRWLSAWVAIVLCAQALSSGSAALVGTLHRHTPLAIDAKPMIAWRHAEADSRAGAAVHARAHRADEPHHHPIDDVSLLPAGSDAAAAALAAFVAAPAPPTGTRLTTARLQHVWTAAVLWTPTAHSVMPPRQPPRPMR